MDENFANARVARNILEAEIREKAFRIGDSEVSKEELVTLTPEDFGVTRSDLVGEYVGQTAPKTLNKIKEAYGGVLFIDEAYSLNGRGSNDFGREAIATLIKEMKDNRDKLVVIMAGYNREMKGLLNLNPGIESRVKFTKVPEVVKVDGKNIELPVNKDETYYVTKAPVSENILLNQGWNTINGSTYRVEGVDLKSGWVLENNTWYYMNETSKARIENNWNLVNNKWYAFNEKGDMKTGWYYSGTSWYFLDTTNGDMKTGWKQDGDAWYNLFYKGLQK